MTRNLPPTLRRKPASVAPQATPTSPDAAPADARPTKASATSATSSSTDKPKIVIHVATPDLGTMRHLQGLGRITVWADHRTPAEVEIRVRTMKDPQTVKLEALLDEIAPGWTWEE